MLRDSCQSGINIIRALVGFLRKMLTSVHGYEQDKEHLFMYTRICVFVCFELYCRSKVHTERMDMFVKEIVTEASSELSNWSLIRQDRPLYLKKGLSTESTNFPTFQKSGSYFKSLGCRRVTWNKFHTEDLQKLGATTVQNSVAQATWRPSAHLYSPYTAKCYSVLHIIMKGRKMAQVFIQIKKI
jgi:hypothetical protein